MGIVVTFIIFMGITFYGFSVKQCFRCVFFFIELKHFLTLLMFNSFKCFKFYINELICQSMQKITHKYDCFTSFSLIANY